MATYEKAVRKYRRAHAEPECALVGRLPGSWSHALVVPARRESADGLDRIVASARTAPGPLLVILVVNGEADHPRDRDANEALLRAVRERPAARAVGDGALLVAGDGWDLLMIDRAGPGRELPPRRGVGLARKIGTDVALELWAEGRIDSPWLHASDADAIQPSDRFAADPPAGAVVAWHPFVHELTGDPSIDEAIVGYDLSLRYYVNGLRWARSPWAFPTVGSTVTVRADAYAAVRGYPRREAGEDFYLLAKLAKLGSVVRAATGPVRLRGRTSDRVPFGTGAGIARLLGDAAAGRPARIYHPDGFDLLRRWQAAVRDGTALEAVDWGSEAAATAGETALRVLEARGSLAALPRSAWVPWFDAFRTLRFLHEVRDAGFARPERDAALRRAAEIGIPQDDYPERFRRRPTMPVATSAAQNVASTAPAPALRPDSGK